MYLVNCTYEFLQLLPRSLVLMCLAYILSQRKIDHKKVEELYRAVTHVGQVVYYKKSLSEPNTLFPAGLVSNPVLQHSSKLMKRSKQRRLPLPFLLYMYSIVHKTRRILLHLLQLWQALFFCGDSDYFWDSVVYDRFYEWSLLRQHRTV